MFAAEDTRLGRQVHLDFVFRADDRDVRCLERARSEAEQTCWHPSEHVARIYAVEQDPGFGLFLVREAMEGETLHDCVLRDGAMPLHKAHPILEQILMALSDGHAVGMVHLWLNAAKVFLERSPAAATRVKLLDYGLHPFRPMELTTRPSKEPQSALLWHPEPVKGVSIREPFELDLHACATIIYFALMLKHPSNPTTDQTARHREVLGPQVEAFLSRAISPARESGFSDAVEALEAWRALRPASLG